MIEGLLLQKYSFQDFFCQEANQFPMSNNKPGIEGRGTDSGIRTC
jgi:hypothetical protein